MALAAGADHASIAHTKDIDIGIDGDPQVCVQGDFEALRVMLGNLVDNAIRYTQRGGRIDVGVRMEDDQPVLTVQDNGPGISAEFDGAPSIVLLEHHRTGAFVIEPDDVAGYKTAVDKIERLAMSSADSLTLITRTAPELAAAT